MPKPSIDLVRGVPLFSDLDDKAAAQLADEFIERFFEPGQNLSTEGESGLNFFVVESGEATVDVHGTDVGTLGPGASFGEVALVDKAARSATITAKTAMHCYGLPVWSFRPFVEHHPEVAWKLLEILAERIRTAESR